jgi:threonine aldolase
MVNQVALRTLTRPGDDVIVSRECHAVWHEAGGSGANSGVQFSEIGEGGVFSLEAFQAAVKPLGHPMYPPTTLVEIENTHNRSGGVIFPQAEIVRICAAAREGGVMTYLDGARIWNAAIASGKPLAELCAPFDLAGACFSKGLGAPGGSILAGSRDIITRATRYRRMLGGAMRQVGIFAAAGWFALDRNLEGLAEDHANARLLAERLAAVKGVQLDLKTVQTNIIVFGLAAGAPDAATLVAKARERGVLLNAFGPRKVRAVTHLDVSKKQCEQAADILAQAVEAKAA